MNLSNSLAVLFLWRRSVGALRVLFARVLFLWRGSSAAASLVVLSSGGALLALEQLESSCSLRARPNADDHTLQNVNHTPLPSDSGALAAIHKRPLPGSDCSVDYGDRSACTCYSVCKRHG